MQEIPWAECLETRISAVSASDPASAEDMREVARRVAVFHAECEIHHGIDSPGSWESVRRAWVRECDEIDRLGEAMSDPATRTMIRRLGLYYLAGRRPLFDGRVRAGQVREGHGDLGSEPIYFTGDEVRIVDRVEFDPALRVADVLADVAFVAIDLERSGSPESAAEFLANYGELSATSYPTSLLDYYIAFWAIVRAKVGAIRADQTVAVDPEVTRLIELAVGHLRHAVPFVVCLGGLPGSGKSTLSEEFARNAGAVHISSDEIRRGYQSVHHGGVETDRWECGPYTHAATEQVYRELMCRAATALSEGYSVVLDASWGDADQRGRAHGVARAHDALAVDVLCQIEENTAFRRLARSSSGFSEVGVQTRAFMRKAFAPWPTAQVVRTDRNVDEVLPDLQRVVAQSIDTYARGVGTSTR
jgi:predicted kinase